MAFTRDVNLKFNSATKIINEKPQVDKEDATFEKDVEVAGNLAVTGSFTFTGPPPVWLAAPLTFLDTVECQNTLTLTGAGALGDLTTDNGDITATAGNIEATAGTITAGGDIATTAGDVLVPAGNVTVGTGDVEIAVAGSFSTLLGDITTTAGNIETTLGDITATDGDVIITQGNLSVLNTVPGVDGNLYVGRTCELYTQAASVAPVVAGSGTLTNDDGLLVWNTAASGVLPLTNMIQDTGTPAGGGTDTLCVSTVPDGHAFVYHGFVVAQDTIVPANFAYAEITGLVTATGGAASLQDSSVTIHHDGITLAGAKVHVTVAGATMAVTVLAHAANATKFTARVEYFDVTL
jgi:hypothetical protein